MRPAWTPQQSARIAGAAYLITNLTSDPLLFVGPKLVVAGDIARTASNLMEHALWFRVTIVLNLITVAGCILLNVALYELLAPVHRSLARLAAFWRLIEQAVYGTTTVGSVVVLSVLSGADYAQAFEPRQLQGLARILLSAGSSGFWVAMFFLSLGSAIYCYLLVRSRYIPKVLALSGVAASALALVAILTRFLFPAFITSTLAAVRTLPLAALVLIALLVVPIFSFEFTIGAWLLVKGVRIPEHT